MPADDLIDDLIRALEYCREQFKSYRDQHIAKMTSDSLKKAATNQEHIDFIDAAITNFVVERDDRVALEWKIHQKVK